MKPDEYERWIEIPVTACYPYSEGIWLNMLKLTTDQALDLMRRHEMVIYNSRDRGPEPYEGPYDETLLGNLFLNKGYITFETDLALYKHDGTFWLIIRTDGRRNDE